MIFAMDPYAEPGKAALPLRNLRHTPEFSGLARVIVEAADGLDLLFVPSPGNWGDAMINVGSHQFLRKHGIAVQVASRHRARPFLEEEGPRPVLVGGGGGWCRYFHSTPGFVNEILAYATHVIVLPSSIEVDYSEGLLDDKRVTIVSRGRQAATELGLPFCHDMAFFLQSGYDLPVTPAGTPIAELRAFRTDREAAESRTDPGHRNMDLSLLGGGYDDPTPLLSILARHETVHTDRLHIAIGAALTGRSVVMEASGYGKIPDVAQSSLVPHYPGITPPERAYERIPADHPGGRGIDNEKRDATEAEEVRPSVS